MSELTVAFTVDLEPDCPPYLWDTFRGVEEGMPRLLAMLAEEAIPATFFTTGDVARRYPATIRALVDAGHELACHGMTHRPFPDLDRDTARWEIEESAAILRDMVPSVVSFRAPYLRFPESYVGLVEDAGFALDSSLAKYKRSYRAPRSPTTLHRVAASVTSSVLRLPGWVRAPYLHALASPVVLFVHPWEFVDLTKVRLRYDCRFNTGDLALTRVRHVLRDYRARGGTFARMRDLLPSGRAPAKPPRSAA